MLKLQSLFSLLVLAFFLIQILPTQLSVVFGRTDRNVPPPAWAYDPGPNLSDPQGMGRQYVDMIAEIPSMPSISKAVTGDQKFRPAFGPIPTRMSLVPNSAKILFIGQDGTHIAEAAGRPATAGYGGRAQDLANHFGVGESAAFINTFAFTIHGQYSGNNTPYLLGDSKFQFGNIVSNEIWLISQEPASPITQWRNRLIDWIVRNNLASLDLIVTFGGPARDTIASFILSRGGEVGFKTKESVLAKIQVPESRSERAGGNKEFPVPLTQDDKDLYEVLLGRELNYQNEATQKEAMELLQQRSIEAKGKMVFSRGGKNKTGLLSPAQLGGFDISKIKINGVETISLKGLKLSDGSTITKDVLVVDLPHPTWLSAEAMEHGEEAANRAVNDDLEALKPWAKKGWQITADPGRVNKFASADQNVSRYKYGRSDIGPEYYDFGTPASRMVSKSDAHRMDGHPNVIVLGTRDKAEFDMNKISASEKAQPAVMSSKYEMYTSRPRTPGTPENPGPRYVFDSGPGEKYARVMKENLNLKEAFAPKEGKTWENDGISAYHVKNHPSVADFGHFRGTFIKPQVVILADPDGFDDLITSRALTGCRGQLIQGLMNDLKVGDQYLLIKTVPFGMDEATEEEWAKVLTITQNYRKNLLKEIFSDQNIQPKVFVTDGRYADQELKKLISESGIKVPIVTIKRDSFNKSSGMVEVASELAKALGAPASSASVKGNLADIPRSHLPYYARVWEGTSCDLKTFTDRVVNAKDEEKGRAFAEVVPTWVVKQDPVLSKWENDGIAELTKMLREGGFPMPREPMDQFIMRIGIQ